MNGQIPDKKLWHDPMQTNLNNENISKILSEKGILIP